MNHLTIQAIAPAQTALLPRSKPFASFEGALFRLFGQLPPVTFARYATFLIAVALLLFLSGCSAMRLVDSQVASFSRFPAAPIAPVQWSFERLPSQQSLEQVAAARQNQLEVFAAAALSKYGFIPKPLATGNGDYTVQINARVQRHESGPFDDFSPWGMLPGRDYVITPTGQMIYMPMWPRHSMPWYVRDIAILIRDTKDNRIVYETQARHEGRWADDEAVLPAMFAAALQDFPAPPPGRRTVNIEIPR
jgi:hypothetical protein